MESMSPSDEYSPCPRLPDNVFMLSTRQVLVCPKWDIWFLIIWVYILVGTSCFLYQFLCIFMIFMDFSFLSFFVCGDYALQTSQSQTLSSMASLSHSTHRWHVFMVLACSSYALFFLYLLLFYVFLPLIPFILIFHSVFWGTHLILG